MSNSNTGHGHVFPRPDGMRARCGGPGMCSECSRDLQIKRYPKHDPICGCPINEKGEHIIVEKTDAEAR
jgi:hypothetical protein